MAKHTNGAIRSETDEAIARVIEAFDGIVQPDGGRVSFIAVEGGKLRIGYAPGFNPDCPTCVMEPQALGQMMQDMLRDQAPEIEGVIVDVLGPASPSDAALAIGRGV